MKKSVIIASSLLAVVSLAACKKEAEAPVAAPESSTASSNMPGMPMNGTMVHGASTGVITAIDGAKRSVTLDHKEIAAMNWPGMTMSFGATVDQLKGLKVGDHVTFEIDWDGHKGTITTIQKAS